MNTFFQRTEIRAQREPWLQDSIAIRIAQITDRDGARTIALAEPMVLTKLSDIDMCVQLPATMQLRPDEAQQFMDELWRVGIRPTEGAGSVGQLSAVQSHLEDMRSLVFNKPK